LHGDDSELIFFVDPDEESLVVVVEDTSSLWPVSLKTSRLKIFITTLEEEMISNELLLFSFGHCFQGVIFTLKFTFELAKSRGNKLFNFLSLLSRDVGTEWVSSEVSSNSDSG